MAKLVVLLNEDTVQHKSDRYRTHYLNVVVWLDNERFDIVVDSTEFGNYSEDGAYLYDYAVSFAVRTFGAEGDALVVMTDRLSVWRGLNLGRYTRTVFDLRSKKFASAQLCESRAFDYHKGV